MDDAKATKKALRKAALARRRAIEPGELERAGELLMRAALRRVEGLPARSTLAAYVSMGTEIPTMPMIAALQQRSMRVLVPRLGSGLDIGWSELGDADVLESMPRTASGGMRPREPHSRVLGPDALHEASMIFVPALAVDGSNMRLGRGGGWYDRALTERGPHARIVAICWPWERTSEPLPCESHDVAVDEVLELGDM
jgi:5-formyltetrahydrofolate cyclo-ligase